MKKTARKLYQNGIEGMKGLKEPGEIESKDEKSQMYLENNLNKIKNSFPNIYDKYQRFFKYIANKEENGVDYKILLSKVHDINFYDRYNTSYNYLNYFSKLSAEEISIKSNSFLKDLSKGFKFKSVYTTQGKINTKKAYDDLVLNIKENWWCVLQKCKKVFSDSSKTIFQKAKTLFDLRIEIYKKLVLEEENLEFEESVGERVKLKNQGVNLSATSEQNEFNDFLQQIKEE